MLYFKIHQLVDIKNKFSSYFSQNDLYVKITYGNQIRKTTTIWNNNKPIWNEMFLFNYETPNTEIKLELYDADTYSKNELIHTATFHPKLNENIQDFNISIFEVSYGDIFYNTQFLQKKINLLDSRNKILEKKIIQINNILLN
tara:strand:- start:992 stop:1420 length:429 start_codon:yes stop_codon:yes gene_type:complete